MRGKELWLVMENRSTVKLDWSVAPSGMYTYRTLTAKGELNREIYNWMQEKSSQFFSSEQPFERKSLDVA